MEKVVIVSGSDGPDAGLLNWLCIMFPDCEIEIARAAPREPSSTVTSDAAKGSERPPLPVKQPRRPLMEF